MNPYLSLSRTTSHHFTATWFFKNGSKNNSSPYLNFSPSNSHTSASSPTLNLRAVRSATKKIHLPPHTHPCLLSRSVARGCIWGRSDALRICGVGIFRQTIISRYFGPLISSGQTRKFLIFFCSDENWQFLVIFFRHQSFCRGFQHQLVKTIIIQLLFTLFLIFLANFHLVSAMDHLVRILGTSTSRQNIKGAKYFCIYFLCLRRKYRTIFFSCCPFSRHFRHEYEVAKHKSPLCWYFFLFSVA